MCVNFLLSVNAPDFGCVDVTVIKCALLACFIFRYTVLKSHKKDKNKKKHDWKVSHIECWQIAVIHHKCFLVSISHLFSQDVYFAWLHITGRRMHWLIKSFKALWIPSIGQPKLLNGLQLTLLSWIPMKWTGDECRLDVKPVYFVLHWASLIPSSNQLMSLYCY